MSKERRSCYIVFAVPWPPLLPIKGSRDSNRHNIRNTFLPTPRCLRPTWLTLLTSSSIGICFIQALKNRARLVDNKTSFRTAKLIIFSAPTVLGIWLRRGGWVVVNCFLNSMQICGKPGFFWLSRLYPIGHGMLVLVCNSRLMQNFKASLG